MIIADTNVLLRIIILDDPNQAHIAKKLLTENQVYIPKTVFLELGWVLESVYKLDKPKILLSLQSLLEPENVTVEDMPQIKQSLEWYIKGMDFADAIHLSTAFGATNQFVTFDKSLIKKSSKYADGDWRPRIGEAS